MILKLIKEARASGARLRPCCETIGIDTRRVQRWQKQGPDGGEDRRQGPKTTPKNKLSDKEREEVLEMAIAPEFRDLSPNQVVPILADMGIYVASEATFYRILKEGRLDAHRGPRNPPNGSDPTSMSPPDRTRCTAGTSRF